MSDPFIITNLYRVTLTHCLLISTISLMQSICMHYVISLGRFVPFMIYAHNVARRCVASKFISHVRKGNLPQQLTCPRIFPTKLWSTTMECCSRTSSTILTRSMDTRHQKHGAFCSLMGVPNERLMYQHSLSRPTPRYALQASTYG